MPPVNLSPEVGFVLGDVRDRKTVEVALEGVQYVFHMAAETGIGQSMYEVERYFDTNVRGTAVLWEAIGARPKEIRKVILSSSRAVYGEGKYCCPRDGVVFPLGRDQAALARRDWSIPCPVCGDVLESAATDEDSHLQPTSVYGLTKKFQEEICHLMAAVHNVPVVALRYFNVYGSRQSPSNPYTGVVSTFFSRALAGRPIVLFEEGVPQRDFVHVQDVVRANLAALDLAETGFQVFNVGTGIPLTLRAVAEEIFAALGKPPQIEVTSQHRVGDILSCYADLERSQRVLGYAPVVEFRAGILDVAVWISQEVVDDRSEFAAEELRMRGFLINEGISKGFRG